MTRFGRLLGRFGRDESGVFAVIFGLMAIVLVALGGAVVDYVRLEQTRNRAQVALDAAVLALQPETKRSGVTTESIRMRAEALVLAQIGDASVDAKVDRIEVTPDTGQLFLGGDFTMPTMFVRLVGVEELGAAFATEARQGVLDIEVSVALDVTGSMRDERIATLKTAMHSLIDEIVKDDQDPNYSKIALVPYSQAVNAGQYADALRGPVRGPKDIVSIDWVESGTKRITNISRSSTATVTSANHGLVAGQWIYISGVSGMWQVNSQAYMVVNSTADTFKLFGVNSQNYSNYSSGGTIKTCLRANCDGIVTLPGHAFPPAEYVYISNVSGASALNGKSYMVGSPTTNTFVLLGGTYSDQTHVRNTGRAFCTWQDNNGVCYMFRHENLNGDITYPYVNTCVTDRAVNAFNDRPPTITLTGPNYLRNGAACGSPPIVPLTSNRTDLHDAIEGLPATGNTAGSLGILWTWYMLSPEFGYVWGGEGAPAPYGTRDLLKTAIIMTDGEFNTIHSRGVVSRDSPARSSSTSINENSPNGNPYAQSRRYCDEMKNNGIVVYTVGFGLRAGSSAANIMSYCASGPDKAYLATDSAALISAFANIARSISALRLTQ